MPTRHLRLLLNDAPVSGATVEFYLFSPPAVTMKVVSDEAGLVELPKNLRRDVGVPFTVHLPPDHLDCCLVFPAHHPVVTLDLQPAVTALKETQSAADPVPPGEQSVLATAP